ncbi:MAG TPA: sigma-70 family RNA polymerase sigma factor [Candidatus Acidoferrales bacterium]|jgi:RNA polymerase sigma factor (sigma-70 family)|nr:sigma-70 family RNA polymerase sigma factor [Candidatus Acidoferrales bacterium]
MSSSELSPEWVLSSFIPPIAAPQHEITELIVVARSLWPRIRAHAYREQPGKSSDEALAFASEVWEGVLRSVAKTIQRSNGKNWRIKNMEAYLFGAFHHRFNRALKKERRRLQMMQHLPSSHDLERLRQAHDSKAVRDLEQSIQLKEAVRKMDEWTRKVWAARQYGYSWKEIATQLRLTEPQVKLRFRYAIGKLRARLGGVT